MNIILHVLVWIGIEWLIECSLLGMIHFLIIKNIIESSNHFTSLDKTKFIDQINKEKSGESLLGFVFADIFSRAGSMD